MTAGKQEIALLPGRFSSALRCRSRWASGWGFDAVTQAEARSRSHADVRTGSGRTLLGQKRRMTEHVLLALLFPALGSGPHRVRFKGNHGRF